MRVFGVLLHLLLRAVCMDHIHIDAFINQLVEKLPRSFYSLNKHEHGRQETLENKKGLSGMNQTHVPAVATDSFTLSAVNLIVATPF